MNLIVHKFGRHIHTHTDTQTPPPNLTAMITTLPTPIANIGGREDLLSPRVPPIHEFKKIEKEGNKRKSKKIKINKGQRI